MPQTLNIAVCEDEAAETVLLCDILNHSDIQNTYTVFTDADSFLASYEYGKYDLLLMDIYMKDSITGIEAVSIIRETDADIPVAFITTSTEHALESYRLSAIGYIEKPVSAAELSKHSSPCHAEEIRCPVSLCEEKQEYGEACPF